MLQKTQSLGVRAAALMLALLSLLAGCGIQIQGGQAAGGGTQTVTDSVGRQVEIPLKAQRVAALDSFSGEAVVMLGAGEQMVAAPNGVKSDILLQEIYPELSDMAAPMSEATVNAEAVMALKPDLILLQQSLYLSEGERQKIEKLGIPYLVISYTNMEEQIEAIRLIGKGLGAEEKAEEICAYYEQAVERARAIAETIPEGERVRVYHSINEIIRTDGQDTLGNDWISCVGAVDVSVGQELQFADNDYYASMEQIYQWNPDVIICNEANTAAYLYLDQKWKGLKAVQEEKVYNIPVGATRWGQRGSLETFFAIIWLGVTIYPDYYADFDLQQEVTEFYQDVLGLTVDEETYQMMLSGSGIRSASNTSGA